MIKLFCVDCDGCLTDGRYLTTENGVIAKQFNTRDFMGMKLLSNAGIKVAIITSAIDEVITLQCERAQEYGGHIRIFKGLENKLKTIEDTFVPHKYSWDEISYIGDDVLDIELLKMAGLAACPNDAHSSVLEVVNNKPDGIVLAANGGAGCVRELSDFLLTLMEFSK